MVLALEVVEDPDNVLVLDLVHYADLVADLGGHVALLDPELVDFFNGEDPSRGLVGYAEDLAVGPSVLSD